MKKIFFKHLLLSISLSLMLFVFLKSIILDDMAVFIAKNILSGNGLVVINFNLIIETISNITNNISNLILLSIALACFIAHIIILDITKKKKVLLCLLAGVIFGLFLIIRLEPIYSFVNLFIIQIISKLFAPDSWIYLIISRLLSYSTFIFTSILKLLQAILSLLLLIYYVKSVDINNKFKKIIQIFSIVSLATYILSISFVFLIVTYFNLANFLHLPNIYNILVSLGIPLILAVSIVEFIMQKLIYILPFILLIVLLVTCIIYTSLSFKKSADTKAKKLFILLLLPIIVLLVIFLTCLALLAPVFLILLFKSILLI